MREDILAELQLTLECLEMEKFNFNKASLLHGVLMQQISSEYAADMHNQGLKPYSQCVQIKQDKNIWSIKTLSIEAYEQIIEPMLKEEFDEFYLEHDKVTVKIVEKKVNYISKESLFEHFYSENAERIFTIKFKTPTAFKKENQYYFFPDIRSIFSSLMRKYDSTSKKEDMESEETLLQLVENTKIIGYNLNSVKFSLEGVKIPAYMGNIVIRINGPQTMLNFAKLLFSFGNYSGVGIKTALGMGCIEVIEGRGQRR